jgi:hypothetical protein
MRLFKHPLRSAGDDRKFSLVLREAPGIPDSHEKVAGLSNTNLVQQGAELAYLSRHDPEFPGVRREHLSQPLARKVWDLHAQLGDR